MYCCYICKASFTDRDQCKKHMHLHKRIKAHSNIQNDISPKEININANIDFKVEVKDEPVDYEEQEALFDLQECDTGEKFYQCSNCKKSFAYRFTLKTKMMTHTGGKPYKCSYCEKEFSEKDKLDYHEIYNENPIAEKYTKLEEIDIEYEAPPDIKIEPNSIEPVTGTKELDKEGTLHPVFIDMNQLSDGRIKRQSSSTKPCNKPLHPSYKVMIINAIETLDENSGSSQTAILRYMLDNYDFGGVKNFTLSFPINKSKLLSTEKNIFANTNRTLKKLLAAKEIIRVSKNGRNQKITSLAGRFKLADKTDLNLNTHSQQPLPTVIINESSNFSTNSCSSIEKKIFASDEEELSYLKKKLELVKANFMYSNLFDGGVVAEDD